MKHSIVIWESLDFLGGGQKLALETADALKISYNVQFLLPGPGKFAEEIERKGYRYSFFFNRNFTRGKKRLSDFLKFLIYFPITFISSFKSIARLKPDLIYSNATPTFLYSAIIGLLLRRPVIWNVCNYYQDRKVVLLLGLFGKLGSVKKIVFVSKALQAQFPRLLYKSVVIYPGIDQKDFLSFDRDRDLRRDLGIDDNTKIIAHIGWVAQVKGQHVVVEAAKLVCKERDDVCFLIVGKNLEGQEWYLEKLEKNIRDNDLEKNVRILGFYDDIRYILAESFLNLIASFEGFPLIMMEAAVFNVPTVGPDVGGTAIDIKENNNGLLYMFQDAQELTSSILKLIQNEELYSEIKKNVSAFIDKYTLESYRENLMAVVGQAIAR